MREATWSLPELVAAVVKELGPDWTQLSDDTTHSDARKIQKGDVILFFHQASYGSAAEIGRVRVSAAYWHLTKGVEGGYTSPRSYGVLKYDEKEPEISVAVSRGAAVVAKEIQRRLLPEVERITAGMKEKVAEALAYQDQSQANAEQFAAAIGGKILENHGHGNGREVPVYANGDGIYLSARVGGDSVRFEHFTCDYITAIRIAQAIRPPAVAEFFAAHPEIAVANNLS